MNDATVLTTHQLSKSYGSRPAVKHLDLDVRRGEIFGFLGPNGAGKTTTIRMALGLIRPSSGRVEVLGRDIARHKAQVLPRVGALVESPALYTYMSGRDNLRAFAAVLGGVPARRLDEVLDEPANGLDPAGIVEMRDLMRRLAASGKTIFVSSHVLGEVQQICDRVAIINLGQLVRVAPVADLIGAHGEFEVKLENPERALQLVREQPWGSGARLQEGTLVTTSPSGRGRDLVQFLAQAGCWPDAVSERQHDLEEIFLDLTTSNGGVN